MRLLCALVCRWGEGLTGRVQVAKISAILCGSTTAAVSYGSSWARLTGRKANIDEVIRAIREDKDNFVANNPDLTISQDVIARLQGLGGVSGGNAH